MNPDTTRLEHLERPELHLPLHKQALKTALLSSPRFRKAEAARGPSLAALIQIHITTRSLVPAGFAVLALAVIVSTFAVSPLVSSEAHAKEALERAAGRLEQLNDSQRAALEQEIKADLETTLVEARAASDLTTLSAEAFARQYRVPTPDEAAEQTDTGLGAPDPIDFIAKVEPGAGAPVLLPVETYLQYTNPEGRKTVIGLDARSTVVLKMVQLAPGERPDPVDDHGSRPFTEKL